MGSRSWQKELEAGQALENLQGTLCNNFACLSNHIASNGETAALGYRAQVI